MERRKVFVQYMPTGSDRDAAAVSHATRTCPGCGAQVFEAREIAVGADHVDGSTVVGGVILLDPPTRLPQAMAEVATHPAMGCLVARVRPETPWPFRVHLCEGPLERWSDFDPETWYVGEEHETATQVWSGSENSRVLIGTARCGAIMRPSFGDLVMRLKDEFLGLRRRLGSPRG